MSDWNVHKIVQILLEDIPLIRAKQIFGRNLSIDEHILFDLGQQNLSSYTYIFELLKEWISRNGKKATIYSLAKILRKNEFVTSAEALSLHACISAPIGMFGVKDPVYNFVPREKELKKLNELFTETKACMILISAMGGKGKTELCRIFIQQLLPKNDILVTWFSGDCHQNFIETLTDVSQEMNIDTKDSTGTLLPVTKIFQKMEKKRDSKWVVVFDNLDEIFSDFYPTVNYLLGKGAFVLVTSRKKDIQTVQYLDLGDLEDRDACEFVRSSFDEIPSQELITELCKSLQNYPLALQQAVAFIKFKQQVEHEDYGIKEYLEELNSDTSKVFDYENLLTDYKHTVLTVFKLTLSKIMNKPGENSHALSLLHILSLVQPDGIQKNFLRELFSIFELEELFASSISTLKTFSLIRYNKEEVSVHRIVQQLTRDRMKSEKNFRSIIHNILKKIDPDEMTMKSIYQVMKIWNNALQEPKIIMKNSIIGIKISKKLFELTLYKELKDISETTLKQFDKHLEPDHVHSLRIQYWLALALEYNGEYEEAYKKLKTVWEKEKTVLDDENEQILDTTDQIASILWILNRFDESLEWYEKLLNSRKKVQSKTHQSIINTKHNIDQLSVFLCFQRLRFQRFNEKKNN